MSVYFRVDGSPEIGMGHISRCITISMELIRMGFTVTFLLSNDYAIDMIRSLSIYAVELVCERPYSIEEISLLRTCIDEKEESILIVDSYYAGDEYLNALESIIPTIYIDGLYHCRANISGVINYNAAARRDEYKIRFAGMKTKLIIGTEYTPVKRAFKIARNKRSNRIDVSEKLNVLITTGATDRYDVIEHLCRKIISRSQKQCQYHIVLGKSYSDPQKIYALLSEYEELHVYCDVKDMASLMSNMDIAISAAGTTVYELLCVGVPAIVYGTVDIHASFEKLKPNIVWIGDIRSATMDEFDKKINYIIEILYLLIGNKRERELITENALSFIDGDGALRLCNEIISLRALRGDQIYYE